MKDFSNYDRRKILRNCVKPKSGNNSGTVIVYFKKRIEIKKTKLGGINARNRFFKKHC